MDVTALLIVFDARALAFSKFLNDVMETLVQMEVVYLRCGLTRILLGGACKAKALSKASLPS